MRKSFIASGIAITLIASGCGLVAEDAVVASPNEDREIIIDMNEFTFGVDKIEVTAGETVTFVLLNSGDNEHEFMIGRNVQITPEGYPDGFEHDFFEEITPMVEPPEAGMMMGAGGMDGMDMSGDEGTDDSMEGMDMSGDEATDDSMEGMDMSGDEATDDSMEGMDMSGDEGTDEEHDEGGGDEIDLGDMGHAGFMVQRMPDEEARITVEIPLDAVGDWDVGCFRGRGAHWDAGMRASLTVIGA